MHVSFVGHTGNHRFIFVLFSSSTYRWGLLKEAPVTVKRALDTRCSVQGDAVKFLKKHFHQGLDVLKGIAEGPADNETIPKIRLISRKFSMLVPANFPNEYFFCDLEDHAAHLDPVKFLLERKRIMSFLGAGGGTTEADLVQGFPRTLRKLSAKHCCTLENIPHARSQRR